jgi:hypothetical protein
MSGPGTSLQPATPDPTRARLAALELQVAARESELDAFKGELQTLQDRYLADIGPLYAELDSLESTLEQAEIRAGLRPPPLDLDEDEENGEPADPDAADGCSNRSTPSVDLKKIFRDVARAVHPDRARDDRARYRRHSLMAEANRAYAERDEDRLRLILRTWEHSTDATVEDGAEDEEQRVPRRLGILGDRLVEIEAEFADLRASAIARLKRRIDETAAQGWDLFGEMQRQVRREIERAKARIEKAQRAYAGMTRRP